MSTYFNISDKIAVKKAPTGYAVAFAGDFINVVTATFSITDGQQYVKYYYTLEDSLGTTVTGDGTFGASTTATVNVDTTTLTDGLITLSVYLVNPLLGLVSDTATRRVVTGVYVTALQSRMDEFEGEDCAYNALTALQNIDIV